MAKVVKPPATVSGGKRAAERSVLAPPRKAPGAPAAAGRFGRLGNLSERSLQRAPAASFFRESLAELKKVHWPTREQTIQMTIIVIVTSLATGFILGGLDFVFAQVIAFLVGAH